MIICFCRRHATQRGLEGYMQRNEIYCSNSKANLIWCSLVPIPIQISCSSSSFPTTGFLTSDQIQWRARTVINPFFVCNLQLLASMLIGRLNIDF